MSDNKTADEYERIQNMTRAFFGDGDTIAPTRIDRDERDECVRQLRVWNNRAPDALLDAIGDLPREFLIELAEAVEYEITLRHADYADIGEKLLRRLAENVREIARREMA